MVYTRVYLLPLAVFIIGPLTFLVTYLMAVLLDHVAAWFPYISETGSFPPESCVFGQFINIMIFIMLIVVYIKYRQVDEFCRLRPKRGISLRGNRVSCVLGALSCLGLDLVANFQESNVLSVHLVGAGVCFVCGTAYFCMQVSFSRSMCPEINSSQTVYLRVLISVMCVVFTLSTIIAAIISIKYFDGEDHRKWKPTDGGYAAHITSTVSEWLLALTYLSFILSFIKEFTNIHVGTPTVTLTNVLPEVDPENGNGVDNKSMVV